LLHLLQRLIALPIVIVSAVASIGLIVASVIQLWGLLSRRWVVRIVSVVCHLLRVTILLFARFHARLLVLLAGVIFGYNFIYMLAAGSLYFGCSIM
jgi:hypothetical protein